jgi:hypothetical protein
MSKPGARSAFMGLPTDEGGPTAAKLTDRGWDARRVLHLDHEGGWRPGPSSNHPSAGVDAPAPRRSSVRQVRLDVPGVPPASPQKPGLRPAYHQDLGQGVWHPVAGPRQLGLHVYQGSVERHGASGPDAEPRRSRQVRTPLAASVSASQCSGLRHCPTAKSRTLIRRVPTGEERSHQGSLAHPDHRPPEREGPAGLRHSAREGRGDRPAPIRARGITRCQGPGATRLTTPGRRCPGRRSHDVKLVALLLGGRPSTFDGADG